MIDRTKYENAQAGINRCREQHNEVRVPDPEKPWMTKVIKTLKPGDKEYLPPVNEFVTIEYPNGFVTVPADYFNRLSKRKKAKLLKAGREN